MEVRQRRRLRTMSIDIFTLRDRIVEEYRSYVESFVHIRDPRLDAFVRDELEQGRLWPQAVLQLNPNYVRGARLEALAAEGVITAETARFFGPELHLYRHQEQAIRLASAGRSFVVATGTGSGKSLTYLVPMVDAVFRAGTERPGVRGLCVYPMNALIGSQLDALEQFRRRNWPDCPLTFARYTGQDRSTEFRNRLLSDPPHILLTNYVMLELVLVRPTDRVIVERMTRHLSLLAVDELHVYRGRQGADVAMLLRRLRERVGRGDLLCIGTSATIATGSSQEERRRTIAEVGARLFGVAIGPEEVVDESLERLRRVAVPEEGQALRDAVLAPAPEPSVEALRRHPLAAWIEAGFGVTESDGILQRARPRAFAEGVAELAAATGLETEVCRAALARTLEVGSRTMLDAGTPYFAFRLHQFLASGASIYATLEGAQQRVFSAEPCYRLAGDPERLLYPLAFCRECGQEFYLVGMEKDAEGLHLLPRPAELDAPEEDVPGEAGFLVLEDEQLWNPEEEGYPDAWVEFRNGRERVKSKYRPHLPQRLWVRPEGTAAFEPLEGAVAVRFQPRPLMICPCCRTSFDLRQKRDFGKLVTLTQTGRSTATTIQAVGTIETLSALGAEPGRRKLLSFTDNRQDAALQAGHTNDFVQVVLVRGALVRALDRHGEITFERLGRHLFEALDLPPAAWMLNAVEDGPGFERARRVMIDLLDHLAIADLARAWRVTQPNLEQCGLLRIDYQGLDTLAGDTALWRDLPILAAVSPETRAGLLRAFLDHLRRNLAVESLALDRDHTRELVRRIANTLRDPWAFDEADRLPVAAVALLPGERPRPGEAAFTLGARSTFGRYLRRLRTLGLEAPLPAVEVETLIRGIVERLLGHLLKPVAGGQGIRGVRLDVGAMLWRPGDGEVPDPDPVRTRSAHLLQEAARRREPNPYFTRLYSGRATALHGLRAAEHTGQVANDKRLEREQEFREGRLSLLCCSPTMELGIDIRDLAVVHLRNLPPDPARYAQRGGRAGRGGQPALVLAFASAGSPHDRHYFAYRERMISGSVTPPVFDLANRELLLPHLHAMWLAATGIGLGNTMDEVIDRGRPDLPLQDAVAARRSLSADARKRLLAGMARLAESALGRRLEEADSRRLEHVLDAAPESFDRSFDRWRELFRAALRAREEARARLDRPHLGRRERKEAEARAREAQRELDLLLNNDDRAFSDFYPYRYLASEGFIPGYNFPRLPVRVFVPASDCTETVDRSRFIGLAEFGPNNLLYHEGRRHRIAGWVLPPGGLEAQMIRAKRCRRCSYLHAGEHLERELCLWCGQRLDGAGAECWIGLVEQRTARARRTTRISCEEEERAREGYDLQTAFECVGQKAPSSIRLVDAGGAPVLELRTLQGARLWRVNRGWRKARQHNGFAIDPETGIWARREEDAPAGEGHRAPATLRVMPCVRDTRNLLFIGLEGELAADEAALLSFAHALRRTVQRVFELEEQELAVELLGEEEARTILLWEAAEGGLGLVERLQEETNLRQVARAALELLHVDPDSGEEIEEAAERCGAACYECLLSYANQRDHARLDRRLVIPIFARLCEARIGTTAAAEERRDERYQRLRASIDPASAFERRVLEAIYSSGLPMPDEAQYCPADDLPVQVDFYYRRHGAPGICVFVDGPAHREREQERRDSALRAALEARGFPVLVVRGDAPLEEVLARLREWIGS